MYNITTLEKADFGGLYFISEVLYLDNKIFYLVKIGQAIDIQSRMSTYNTHNTAYHNFPNSAIQIEDKTERDVYENIAHTRLKALSVYCAKKAKEWFYISEYVFNSIKDNPWQIIFENDFFDKLLAAPESKIKYKEIEQDPQIQIEEKIIYKEKEKIVYKEKDNTVIEEQYQQAKRDIDFYKNLANDYYNALKIDKDIENRINNYAKLGIDLSKRGFWGRLMFALGIY